jgi:hypothetical protein
MGCSCSLFAGGLDGVAGHAQLAHGGAQGTGADDLSAFSLNMAGIRARTAIRRSAGCASRSRRW